MSDEIEVNFFELVKRVDTENMGDFIKYDREKCNGCGMCALVCSFNLWAVKASRAKLAVRYQELCLECGACWEVCEPGAIDFSYPKGGTGVVIEFG